MTYFVFFLVILGSKSTSASIRTFSGLSSLSFFPGVFEAAAIFSFSMTMLTRSGDETRRRIRALVYEEATVMHYLFSFFFI